MPCCLRRTQGLTPPDQLSHPPSSRPEPARDRFTQEASRIFFDSRWSRSTGPQQHGGGGQERPGGLDAPQAGEERGTWPAMTGARQRARGHGRQPRGIWLLNGSRADGLREVLRVTASRQSIASDLNARVSPPRRPGARGRSGPVQRSACLPDGQPLRLEAHIRHARFTVDAAQPVVAADPVPPAHRAHPRWRFSSGTAAAAIETGAAAPRTTAGRQRHGQQEDSEHRGRERQAAAAQGARGTATPSRELREPHSPAGRWAPPPGRSAGRCAAG